MPCLLNLKPSARIRADLFCCFLHIKIAKHSNAQRASATNAQFDVCLRVTKKQRVNLQCICFAWRWMCVCVCMSFGDHCQCVFTLFAKWYGRLIHWNDYKCEVIKIDEDIESFTGQIDVISNFYQMHIR